MTREEAINKLIRIRQLQGGKSEAHEALGMAIDALAYQAELPEGLEEAAFTYENDLWESGFKDCGYSPQEVNDAFIAGAEWMAEQGESYTAEVIMLPVGIKKIQHTVEGFEPGEEVIVQIRKK